MLQLQLKYRYYLKKTHIDFHQYDVRIKQLMAVDLVTMMIFCLE